MIRLQTGKLIDDKNCPIMVGGAVPLRYASGMISPTPPLLPNRTFTFYNLLLFTRSVTVAARAWAKAVVGKGVVGSD